eukprot:MONOS_6046.1-p1 / transcript=MONOS_6046.1 / gene=MONOS_6046 / organism=Monocercomonoides_exilis_PA203 / gene_product=unspecified product / transcript_product=unspecified product / location=Mono_scaffold00185:58394-59827(-) / protein_length=478 / sequence_SO=supercontig / SO=protein_coding / is_pseudo=false
MDNHSLFEDIANAMRESFAANYTRMDNRRHVIGYDSENHREFDFTVLYFDPHPPKPENMKRAFVKNRGNGDGITVEKAIDSISDAYDYLDKSGKCFIDIIKTDDLLKADPVLFKVSNGITIEGVNGNGEGNTEVVVDCDVSESSVLFFCLRMVEFKYLAFQFSATKKSWDFFIRADPGLERLVLSHCQFVRVGSQSQRGMNSNDDGDNSIGYNLITVCDGTVEMNTVKCTDETSFVTFSSSPFSFSGASEVLLNGVEISNLKFSYGPAIFISDSEETAAKIFIEGLNIKNSHSELGYTAGLWISLVSEESTVAIGRNDKCSFKSCSAPEGKSGAIFIDMPKATSNLQLPSANNLEIDSSNTAGSESTSLFIIAPDFDEFCKQEDAFEFANDYDESTSGWIKGAKDEESEPEDVYEKYVKVRQEQLKKKKVGTIVAIVVPVVVVVVAAVVAVVIVVVVRKRRKRNEENENKEQEMNSL